MLFINFENKIVIKNINYTQLTFKQRSSSTFSFCIHFPCCHGLDDLNGTSKLESCRFHFDMACFLWLYTLPCTNYSLSVVDTFYMSLAEVPFMRHQNWPQPQFHLAWWVLNAANCQRSLSLVIASVWPNIWRSGFTTLLEPTSSTSSFYN